MAYRSEIEIAKAIASGLTDAAVLLDTELRAIAFNPALALFIGLRHRALEKALAEARDFFTLFGNEASALRDTACRAIAAGRVVRLDEVVVNNVAAQSRTMITTFIPVLDGENVPSGVLIVIRDVSAEASMQTRYKELMALERARADQLERQVAERTRELAAALEEVTRLSRTDPLTGLANRRAFHEIAEDALTMARRYERTVGILMCDLDHFKRINDTYGHETGDTVLAATAACLERVVRRSDRVARFGGEEFVILLTETSPASVYQVGLRCTAAIRELSFPKAAVRIQQRVTISIGIATTPAHGETLRELLAAADRALYAAKEQGRDRVVVCDDTLPGAQAPSLKTERRRLLLTVEDEALGQQCLSSLAQTFDVVTASNHDVIQSLCHDEHFDVVIADEGNAAAGGLALLKQFMHDVPTAVRILIVDNQDRFITCRLYDFAAIDRFLLRQDVSDHLSPAVVDALHRRDLVAQRVRAAAETRSTKSRTMVQALQDVLTAGNLQMLYQPIFTSADRRPAACEALCRTTEPLFRNSKWMFEVAASSGRVWALSRLVRRQVARDTSRLPSDRLVFINRDPADLDDPELLVGEEFLAPFRDRIVFEITERADVLDISRVQSNLRQLRALGYRFAIDDLGAGYAGLNCVALLEPDFIKLNSFLIRGVELNNNRGRIIRRIVDFANDSGVAVIAEGIETEEEAQIARELGCHMLQGFLFARPGPPEESSCPATSPESETARGPAGNPKTPTR